MYKKHIFLRVFSKITIFACVFCTLSAWADTTTCDIDFTPVTGNSWQNGTPTPTNPVEIESIGAKVGNKYAVQVAVNYDGGVVDLGTLEWRQDVQGGKPFFYYFLSDIKAVRGSDAYCEGYAKQGAIGIIDMPDKSFEVWTDTRIMFVDTRYSTPAEFKSAMSGKMLYYQRATDETWTAPTLRTIYLDEPLRKVGDYADVLDYKNGTITRNVGVKVLDGTENWYKTSYAYYVYEKGVYGAHSDIGVCSHFECTNTQSPISGKFAFGGVTNSKNGNIVFSVLQTYTSLDDFKVFLASEYAKGTPVTVYYPLATPVVEQIENWSCTPPITDIQIATTKMVDDEFAQAEANLAATVQTIESVVSRTIAQTGQIQVLQDTKQTRPDESCPANMKCLLVQDEDGTPHWYPIIEP